MISILDEHFDYAANVIRRDLFRSAISQAVQPGDRVADLGSGTTVLNGNTK